MAPERSMGRIVGNGDTKTKTLVNRDGFIVRCAQKTTREGNLKRRTSGKKGKVGTCLTITSKGR